MRGEKGAPGVGGRAGRPRPASGASTPGVGAGVGPSLSFPAPARSAAQTLRAEIGPGGRRGRILWLQSCGAVLLVSFCRFLNPRPPKVCVPRRVLVLLSIGPGRFVPFSFSGSGDSRGAPLVPVGLFPNAPCSIPGAFVRQTSVENRFAWVPSF